MEYLIKATYRRVLLGDQPLLVGDGGGQCKLAVVAPGGRSYHIIDASPAWQVSKLMKQIEKIDGTPVHVNFSVQRSAFGLIFCEEAVEAVESFSPGRCVEAEAGVYSGSTRCKSMALAKGLKCYW